MQEDQEEGAEVQAQWRLTAMVTAAERKHQQTASQTRDLPKILLISIKYE